MKTMIQNHEVMAQRLNRMLNVLYSIGKPTDEQKKAMRQFEEQIAYHRNCAMIFKRKTFIMVLR